MKKIISMILICMLLLTGTVAFAQETAPASIKNKVSQAIDNYKAKLAEIKPLQEQIRANHTEIQKLKAEAKNAHQKAKSRIKELKQNKDNITPEQIESIKTKLSTLKQDKQTLGGTIGDIKDEMPNFKAARSAKNIEDAKKSLNNIIGIQNTRIQKLKTIIDNLNNIGTL